MTAIASQHDPTRGRPCGCCWWTTTHSSAPGCGRSCRPRGDLEVIGEAADGAAAIVAASTHRVDVVLMDVRMPGVDGIAATKRITALPDPPKVIVLTTFQLDEYVFGALRAGASGFLLKDTPPADIAGAVRLVAAGEAMLSPSVTRTLIDHYSADTAAARRIAAENSLNGADRPGTRSRRRGGARPVQRRHRRTPLHERGDRQGARVPRPDQAERDQPGTSGIMMRDAGVA